MMTQPREAGQVHWPAQSLLALGRRLQQAEARSARLHQALVRYGRHDPSCRLKFWVDAPWATDCTCGLEAALNHVDDA